MRYCCWLPVFLCLAARASEIPSGTEIHVRLNTAINTSTAKAKQPVEMVVIAPVLVGGEIAIGTGTKIEGQVKSVTPAAKADDQATLVLQFDRIVSPGGNRAPLSAILKGIDNARESVDDQGKINGIIASQTGSGRLDQGINKVAERYQSLADILSAVKQAVLKDTDANIAYDPGVEMTIQLTKALQWSHPGPAPNVRDIEPANALAALVNREPIVTMATSPRRPSDVTNIMFIGSAADIQKAFESAGWSVAEKLGQKSKFETFRAMAEERGYKEAPVSILLLDGRPPDLVFEKGTNTFNARHHLRIWRRPETFDGKSVWVCGATHDIGIDFSEKDLTFIHKIDSHIDDERAKVVNDLIFAGAVRGLALADRPNAPRSGRNATGDAFETDGRMAVVEF
ncbi:MAG TPA: LssY C-terminal domain-containing protein [Bryobacteraceae bacterium]|nr:LssY C-terminal domain-containing protein [Bryobacteraceae bacterium]